MASQYGAACAEQKGMELTMSEATPGSSGTPLNTTPISAGLDKREREVRTTFMVSNAMFAAAALALVLLILNLAGVLHAGPGILRAVLLLTAVILLGSAVYCLQLARSGRAALLARKSDAKNVDRLSTELELAKNIQSNMLPSIYPAFPEQKEFDVYARTEPAKELGGDFFDFQMIDKDHLAIIIADVAGKGIPAAMFMMASKIIISNLSKNRSHDPAKILKMINKQIGANNHADMFVTLWLGILDTSTGVLSSANAGHEYPCIRHKGNPFLLLKDPHGLVLGVMDKVEYRSYDIQLAPGDTLFVYTDGVTEATNSNDELFGLNRMVDALNLNPDVPIAQLVDNVRSSISAFSNGADQADDITMLALRYFGPEGKPEAAVDEPPEKEAEPDEPAAIVKTDE